MIRERIRRMSERIEIVVEVWFKLTLALHESSMGRRMMKCHRRGLFTKTLNYCTINCFYHLELLYITRASHVESSIIVSGPSER
jgi:hypothetical protein